MHNSTSKRGRKPDSCPDYGALRAAHAVDPRPIVIARTVPGNARQIRRWLGELGIHVQPARKLRPRGVTPQFARLAYRPDGKRITCTLYNIWHSMRLRCLTPGYRDYKYYGGRGITICSEWDAYEPFRAWALANGFRKGMTLERGDVNGGYSPDNCSWIPQSDQQLNTRRVKMLTLNGVTKALPLWAREIGMTCEQLRSRVNSGWSHEQALTLPLGASRPGMLRGRAAAKAKRLAAMGTERR